MSTKFIPEQVLSSSDPKCLQVALQNVSISTPIVSFLPLSVLDGRKPSVEPCQSLNGLKVPYVA